MRQLSVGRAWAALVLGSACTAGLGADVLVEAESFSDRGGWVVDQQFVDVMGSPYALAHGMGTPVANAVTTVQFPATGDYRLWVRTKDWVPPHHPGTFKVIVGGTELAAQFGTEGTDWLWQDGGTVAIATTDVQVELRDLTGFDGRCDALLFTTTPAFTPPNTVAEMTPWRRGLLGLPETPPSAGDFDVVIVGGGITGCCASLAAARFGLTVALIHDRPFLGGNASQEIRVHTLGVSRSLVDEINRKVIGNGSDVTITYDERRHSVMEAEANIALFLRWRAFAAHTEGARIVSVDARHIETGEEKRFTSAIFIDTTGDGWIGYWAGAEYSVGREARSLHDESLAPVVGDGDTLGTSVLWTSHEAGAPVGFPDVSAWTDEVTNGHEATQGQWYWEYGIQLDTIQDAEEIRDHLLRAIYGSFYNAKQVAGNENTELHWVAYVGGRRESRRLVGDYLLTEDDVRNNPDFPDAVVEGSWPIDLHYTQTGDQDFLTYCEQTNVARYWIPFRCLYSVNIENLMMAGRCLSATHVGLGSPRVMNTCGQMGVAVGCAAFLCNKYGATPRGVYQDHLAELKLLVADPTPEDITIKVTNIVDNADATGVDITGAWQDSTFDSGYYGTNYMHDQNADKGAKSVRFTPNLAAQGTYNVYLRWTASANRATNAPVDVTHAGGTATATVDQTANGGKWMLLGTWEFDAGTAGSVLLRTDLTDGHVIADAVRFALPRAARPTIDPAGGTFAGSVQVTLTCATAGAEIRYTTDGTEPTAASTLYDGPFTLTTSATIKAVAFKSGMAESVSSGAAFAIEAAAPAEKGGGCVPLGGRAAGLLVPWTALVALRLRARELGRRFLGLDPGPSARHNARRHTERSWRNGRRARFRT